MDETTDGPDPLLGMQILKKKMWEGKKQAEVKQERRHVTKIKEEPMRKKKEKKMERKKMIAKKKPVRNKG